MKEKPDGGGPGGSTSVARRRQACAEPGVSLIRRQSLGPHGLQPEAALLAFPNLLIERPTIRHPFGVGNWLDHSK